MKRRLEIIGYVLSALFILWQFVPDRGTEVRTPRLPPPPVQPEVRTPGLPFPSYEVEDEGAPRNSTGTAFAVDDQGLWITARHVARGCRKLGFAQPGRRTLVAADRAWLHPHSDTALVEGPAAREGFAPSPAPVAPGSDAFHIGFPQGSPGDVWSKAIGPARMVTRGRHRSDEPVVAYAEVARYPAFQGSLGGISGGPIFDASGRIIGVSVASSPRRGRILGAVPGSFEALFDEAERRPQPARTAAPALAPASLRRTGDRLRKDFTVAKVYCFVS